MSVLLARIDDRLIHGQVTVGWSRHLEPECILLCNDDVSADPWQGKVYASTVPPSISVIVCDRAEAAKLLMVEGGSRTILLTSSPADMLDLVRAGVSLPVVNVGGMHFVKGKAELHEFVWLDQGDLDKLRSLLEAGCRLVAQTVPGSRDIVIGAEALNTLESRL